MTVALSSAQSIELVDFDSVTPDPRRPRSTSSRTGPVRDPFGALGLQRHGRRQYSGDWQRHGRNSDDEEGQSGPTHKRRKRGRGSPDSSSRRVRLWSEAVRVYLENRRGAEEGHNNKDNRQGKMKFAHSIQFNAVPEWSAHYIAYSNLKKMYVPFSPSPAALCHSTARSGVTLHGGWT